jgi:hypothetical protein
MDIVAMKAASLPAHIRAALNSKEMDQVSHLLAKSQLKCKRLPMTVAEIDEELKTSGLSISDRFRLKAAMSVVGLLVK